MDASRCGVLKGHGVPQFIDIADSVTDDPEA